jgi:aspartyl aminopeptidase
MVVCHAELIIAKGLDNRILTHAGDRNLRGS